MKLFKRLLAIPLMAVLLLGQGCTKGASPELRSLSQRVTLKVWGVVDDLDAYQTVFSAFRRDHPYVDIQFRRLRLEEYEDELLNALAEDQGPDVLMVHNTWVDKYLSKIQYAPKSVKAAYQIVSGSATNQQTTYEARTVPTLTTRALKNDFPDFVAKDAIRNVDIPAPDNKVVREDRIVALPMAVDTMALFYNKDFLNTAGIATPPQTWGQLQDQVKKLVRQGQGGEIVRAGAAIGLGSNVERSPDLLALLMMQNGAEMADDGGYPTFSRMPREMFGTRETPPGLEAMQFYSEFANPSTGVYTWNAAQPNSLDAFVRGTAGFFFGYNYQLPLIRARAPKLNLGITKIPQIEGFPEVNSANYWLWTVSKKASSSDLAWLLINDMTNADGVKSYLDVAKRPAARKALLADQLEDEDLGVFVSQVLTARTWYRGKDPKGMERAFIELMDQAPTAEDQDKLRDMIRIAEEKVSQTIE